MDWTAFRAREKYLKVRTGAAPQNEATAAATARTYAAYRAWKVAEFPALMNAITGQTATFNRVPQRPPEMTAGMKMGRLLKPSTGILSNVTGPQREAKTLKKAARSDAPLAPEKLATMQALADQPGDAQRTARKALFEYQRRSLVTMLSDRQQKIRALLDGANQKAGSGVGEQRKFLFKRLRPDQPDRARVQAFQVWKDGIIVRWNQELQLRPEEDALAGDNKAKLRAKLDEIRRQIDTANQALSTELTNLRNVQP